jgi:hypothetical protein
MLPLPRSGSWLLTGCQGLPSGGSAEQSRHYFALDEGFLLEKYLMR